MKKYIAYLVLFIFSLLIFPQITFALGQMTEPIVIDNALRGESIEQELIAVNSDQSDLEIRFMAEGDIQDWASFYLPDNLELEQDVFTLKAGDSLRIVAILDIPDDLENGVYLGNFSVSNIASTELDAKESGANVVQKIDRQVSISISDEEKINIENTSVIPNKFDLELEEPLSIRIIYNNEGNIRLSPQVRIKIKKDDKNIHDLIYPYPEDENAVNSKSQHEIQPIVIQTIAWEPGKYFASLDFGRDGESILKKDFVFSIAVADADSENKISANNYILAILLIASFLFIIVWQFFTKSKK
jgi:hypothetical protein